MASLGNGCDDPAFPLFLPLVPSCPSFCGVDVHRLALTVAGQVPDYLDCLPEFVGGVGDDAFPILHRTEFAVLTLGLHHLPNFTTRLKPTTNSKDGVLGNTERFSKRVVGYARVALQVGSDHFPLLFLVQGGTAMGIDRKDEMKLLCLGIEMPDLLSAGDAQFFAANLPLPAVEEVALVVPDCGGLDAMMGNRVLQGLMAAGG